MQARIPHAVVDVAGDFPQRLARRVAAVLRRERGQDRDRGHEEAVSPPQELQEVRGCLLRAEVARLLERLEQAVRPERRVGIGWAAVE